MFFYIYIQSLYRAYFLEEINNSSSRCMLHRNIIEHFLQQYYLVKPIPCISKTNSVKSEC